MAHKLYHVQYYVLVKICVFHKLCRTKTMSDDNSDDANDFASSRDYERECFPSINFRYMHLACGLLLSSMHNNIANKIGDQTIVAEKLDETMRIIFHRQQFWVHTAKKPHVAYEIHFQHRSWVTTGRGSMLFMTSIFSRRSARVVSVRRDALSSPFLMSTGNKIHRYAVLVRSFLVRSLLGRSDGPNGN